MNGIVIGMILNEVGMLIGIIIEREIGVENGIGVKKVIGVGIRIRIEEG